LQIALTVDPRESLVLRCCGAVLFRVGSVLRLKAFDYRCQRLSEQARQLDPRPVATPMIDGAETAWQLVEIIDSLSGPEQSMLVRNAVGFSARELYETYGELVDFEELVGRVVARVQSSRRSVDSNESQN
jgi:hypothetical protein